MLAKRIIPCLDVQDGKVVKGVQFREHAVVGEIEALAQRYRDEGADELVFYDISASADGRRVDRTWIARCAALLDVPFCVAGGIRCADDAREILASGADKISINSPALETPDLIDRLAREFGRQCVVVGIDSRYENGDYWIYQYTGRQSKSRNAGRKTLDWVKEAVERGAGEIVANCMDNDGVKQGYAIGHLCEIRRVAQVPLIASGGAGALEHFADVFSQAKVDGALAASVFHKNLLTIGQVKAFLEGQGIPVRTL